MTLFVISAISFGLVALAWVLYPAAMWLRSLGVKVPATRDSPPTERVAVIVATRDDPAFALARVLNLRASEYPAHLLRVLVSVDVNSVYELESYRTTLAGVADVVSGDPPGGKATTLNAAVRAVDGSVEVLVFADVGQVFARGAVTCLVDALRDGAFGAATGRYTHPRTDGIMSAYADLEAMIRAGQAAGRSVVSATGAILAMRPSLWRELPAGLICDDLYTGLSVVRQHARVGFCRDAVAYDPRVFSRDQQFTRRVRTLTGLIQYCILEPGALLPWSNPVWGHFFIHKVLRLLTPILLAAGITAAAAWLIPRALSETILVVMGIAAAALLARIFAPTSFRRTKEQVLWALQLMLVPVVAISNGLRGRWSVWAPTSQVPANLRAGGGA